MTAERDTALANVSRLEGLAGVNTTPVHAAPTPPTTPLIESVKKGSFAESCARSADAIHSF